jgi:hypothetical protein
MSRSIRFFIFSGLAIALAIGGIYAIGAPDDSMKDRPVSLSPAEAQAVEQFESRLDEYLALHEKLEANLDPPGDESTPEEIDEYRKQLRAQLKTARVGAKRGDLFNPGMETLVKRVCASAFSGEDGEEVKSTVMDENPGKLPDVRVNDRYPDGVPVTTMPGQLLETLPKLKSPVEYRFVGKRLVLVDSAAGMVIDYTPNVMP